MARSTVAVHSADNRDDVGSNPAAPTICKAHGEVKFIRVNSGGKHRWRCGKCVYEAVKRRRVAIKAKAIAYKGGACARCGYNECDAALEFHHLDPTQKDIQVGVKANIAWERIRVELDKCVMLCANCHRAVHWCEVELGT